MITKVGWVINETAPFVDILGGRVHWDINGLIGYEGR